ncbi:MAG: phosphoribosylanthranilate isomerase [Ferroplasma sp.]
MKIKVCGITSMQDAEYAINSGSDFIGVILDENVIRHGNQELLKKIKEEYPQIKTVGVYTSLPSASGAEDYVQLHYPHSAYDIKYAINELHKNVISVTGISGNIDNDIKERLDAGAKYVLIEDRSGIILHSNLLRTIDLSHAGLAGKINSDNVLSIMELKPGLLDVSSSLEEKPGKKSFEKIDEFFKRIGEYDACR